jgi:tetratricopeptide (TPR) repeat protein
MGTATGLIALLMAFSVVMSIAFVGANNAKKAAQTELELRVAAERRLEDQLIRYRDRLVEDALEVLIGGDLEQGKMAIEAAGAEGVPETALQSLKGLSLFFRGKIPEAVEELRKAVHNDPQSVLARSALVVACVQSGDWLFVIDAADALHDAVPQTDCERLMLAWATDSRSGVDDVAKKRPSWAVARILCGLGRVKCANNRDDLDQGIRDIQWARMVVGDSPNVILSERYALTMAIQFGRKHELDTRDWEAACARTADEMKSFPDYFCILQSLCYHGMGDEQAADAMLARAYELGHGGKPVQAARAYGRGEIRQALKELEDLDYDQAELLRALLTAEYDRDKALAMSAAVIKKQQARGVRGAFDPAVLFICGEHQQAARLARQLLDQGLGAAAPKRNPAATLFEENVVRFVAGELTEEEFLVAAGEPPFPNCANFLAGLKHLSAGDREAAKRRFQEAIEPFAPGIIQCHLSEAFLHRMEADVHWPRSIARRRSRFSRSLSSKSDLGENSGDRLSRRTWQGCTRKSKSDV